MRHSGVMNEASFTLTDAALVLTGLMAGVYFVYAVAVMPGLRRLDDHGFVAAFQAIDRAIINPAFLVAFFAPAVLTGISGFVDRGPGHAWIVVAFVLNAAIVVITMAINVPLNDALKARGDVAEAAASEARREFRESRWVAWNWVRVAFNLAAAVSLALS